MNCPKCQANTSVLSTRAPKRRRVCDNGHRFSTVELSLPDVNKLRAASVRLTRIRLLANEGGA